MKIVCCSYGYKNQIILLKHLIFRAETLHGNSNQLQLPDLVYLYHAVSTAMDSDLIICARQLTGESLTGDNHLIISPITMQVYSISIQEFHFVHKKNGNWLFSYFLSHISKAVCQLYNYLCKVEKLHYHIDTRQIF